MNIAKRKQCNDLLEIKLGIETQNTCGDSGGDAGG